MDILDRYVQRRMESHNLEHVHTYYVDEKAMRKGQRFLLLRNHRDLGDSERDGIKSLMSMFPDLGHTYIQKESLRAT